MKYLAIIFLSLLVFQCSTEPDTKETQAQEVADKTIQPTPTQVAPSPAPTYPSITAEKMKYLFDNCDYVDFLFYDLDFSMSQNQRPAIIQTLRGVSTTPANTRAECKPVGRVFFQVKGENAMEADLFFGGSCLYYIFFENGQYVYGNQLTQEGAGFYQKIFTQVTTQQAQ